MRGTSLEENAKLLVIASAIYNASGILATLKENQDAACRRLNAYDVFSIVAIAEIVKVSPYRVERAILGMKRPEARGKLNPAHLRDLSYLISFGKVPDADWIKAMVHNGTDVSTIVDITGISRSTIKRKLEE